MLFVVVVKLIVVVLIRLVLIETDAEVGRFNPVDKEGKSQDP